jgi:hypothetical protein
VAYTSTRNPPPLPPQTPSTAWLCFAVRWGRAGTFDSHLWAYYFSALPSSLGVFHASQSAIDWATLLRPLIQGTHTPTLAMGTVYAYAWDGTTYHAGFGSVANQQGLLLTADRSTTYPVTIKKWAKYGGSWVIGYWRSAPVNSAWMDRDYTVSALGKLQFQNWANLYTTPFVSEGNTWTPCLFRPRTDNSLYPISFTTIFPRGLYYRKRVHLLQPPAIRSNTWLPPVPTPTATG